MKVCAISDLHGQLPDLPNCHLLIVGGDVCPDGFGGVWASKNPGPQKKWFEETFIPWAKEKADNVLVTWGNHDFCGEGLRNATYDNVEVVCDREVEYEGKRIWLSPWSNQFMRWAFMKEPEEMAEVYSKIPEGLDILVSHSPPYGLGDSWKPGELLGSKELRDVIDSKKPNVVVCGHIHGGYGAYELGETKIYNVSIVDEGYRLVNPATEFEI